MNRMQGRERAMKTEEYSEAEHDLDETESTHSAGSIDRQLASLRIGNSTLEGETGDIDELIYTYRQSDAVKRMHRAPRGIGHTNRLATIFDGHRPAPSLFSSVWSASDNDYINGLKVFVGFFVITPFILWIVILLAFKVKYSFCENRKRKQKRKSELGSGNTRDYSNTTTTTTATAPSIPTTCWISGGSVIDMIELSKARVPRKERKQLVLRSWRIQSIFLSVSIGIPILSVVLIEFGWKPLEQAIREIQILNHNFETLAYRGWNAIEGLESSKSELFSDNELVRAILDYDDSNRLTNREPDRKASPSDDRDSTRNDNMNNRHRQLQGQQQWQFQRTPSPTQMQSDIPFFFPFTQMATSSPTEQIILPGKTPSDESNKNDGNSVGSSNVMSEWLEKTGTTTPKTGIPSQPQTSSSGKMETALWKDDTEEIRNKNPSEVPTAPSNSSSFQLPRTGILIEEWCPDAITYIGSDELEFWSASLNTLTENMQMIDNMFSSIQDYFPFANDSQTLSADDNIFRNNTTTKAHSSSSASFRFVTDATNAVDDVIEWIFTNDWLLKLLILVLNVLNGLLLASVYFLTKNNVIHPPTRFYLAYVLVPLFFVTACCVVAMTVASGVSVLINVDFCSGGETASPQGTIEDMISNLQQQQTQYLFDKNDGISNDTLELLFDAVDYYWTGCLTENPLQFLDDFEDDVDEAVAKLNQIMMLFPTKDGNSILSPSLPATDTGGISNQSSSTTVVPAPINTSIDRLNQVCRRDMSFLPPSIQDLDIQVDRIKMHIHKLSDTMSCGQISPLFRRVSHGAMCVESPQGLTVLWSSSFGISILCFVLLTVRAALYNSVKYKKSRPTKPRRVVEKEFEEYKTFMGKYYGDGTTNEWKIEGIPLPPTKLQFEFDKGLETMRTFETATTTKGSGSEEIDLEGGGSDVGGIHASLSSNEEIDDGDSSSYGSSYDSEVSEDDDSTSGSRNGDGSSIIGSILSDTTRSIAMVAINSLRNVKSLLSSSVQKSSYPHLGNNISQKDSGSNDERGFGVGRTIFPTSIGAEMETFVAPVVVDDGKSEVNSIDDDSLYINTPNSVANANKERIFPLLDSCMGSTRPYGLCEEETPVEDGRLLTGVSSSITLPPQRQAWTTPSNNEIASLSSPMAPKKTFSFLSRTLFKGDEHNNNYRFREDGYSNEELQSLVIEPKQLANLPPFRPRDKFNAIRTKNS